MKKDGWKMLLLGVLIGIVLTLAVLRLLGVPYVINPEQTEFVGDDNFAVDLTQAAATGSSESADFQAD